MNLITNLITASSNSWAGRDSTGDLRYTLGISMVLHSLAFLAWHAFPEPNGRIPGTASLVMELSSNSEKDRLPDMAAPNGPGSEGRVASGGSAGGTDSSSPYASDILERVARQKRYPGRERDLGLEDFVTLRFSVDPAGRLIDVELVRRSRYQGFNEEAVSCVRRAAPFPAAPNALMGGSLQLRVTLRFRLDEGD